MLVSQSPIFSHLSAERNLTASDMLSSALVTSKGKITLSDVARAAGVSTTAVSYALNGKGRIPDATRQIVLETARKLGYEANYYAQRIKGGCSQTVAFFSSDIAGVAGEKVIRIQEELVHRGFLAPLHGLGYASSEALVEAVRQIRRQRPRAIVCGSQVPEAALDELRRFRDEEGIVVCYDSTFPPDFEQVTLDRELGAYRVTRHLIEQGHREIGISTHSNCPPGKDGYPRGMARALKEAGLPFREEWYCPAYPFELAGKSLAARFIAMKKRPSAFYVMDDRVASTFAHYLLRDGLQIPDDLSIVTHDPSGVAEHCVVPLTVVSHPVAQIVSSVAAMVVSRLEDNYNGPPRHAVISGQLIERASVRSLLA